MEVRVVDHRIDPVAAVDPAALLAAVGLVVGGPLEVRTVGPDGAHLSPNHKTATTVIPVSGKPGTDYWDYLRAVDALLAEFDARVHWGKLHFLTRERLLDLDPEAEDFVRIRREPDPEGVFLNDHLRPLFA